MQRTGAEQGVETGVVGRIGAVAAGVIVLQHDPRLPSRSEGVARLRMAQRSRIISASTVASSMVDSSPQTTFLSNSWKEVAPDAP